MSVPVRTLSNDQTESICSQIRKLSFHLIQFMQMSLLTVNTMINSSSRSTEYPAFYMFFHITLFLLSFIKKKDFIQQ